MTTLLTPWFSMLTDGPPVRTGEYDVCNDPAQFGPRRAWYDVGQKMWLGIIPQPLYYRGEFKTSLPRVKVNKHEQFLKGVRSLDREMRKKFGPGGVSLSVSVQDVEEEPEQAELPLRAARVQLKEE